MPSYLRPYPSGELELPALSVQVPVTEAAALSGPPYDVEVQVAMPDV